MVTVLKFMIAVICLWTLRFLWRRNRLRRARVRCEKQKLFAGILRERDDECPICWSSPLYQCQAPCGHGFCGGCLLWYWDPNEPFTPCRCFLCDALITKLTPVPISDLDLSDEVWRNVELYNHLLTAGRNGFIQRVIASPLILKMVYHLMKMYDDYVASIRTIHFAGQIYACLCAISCFYPFTLIPRGTLIIIVVLYRCYVMHILRLRRDRPLHYHRWG